MNEGVGQRFMYRVVSQLEAFHAKYGHVSPAPRLVNVRMGKRLVCLAEFRRKIATRSWPAASMRATVMGAGVAIVK
jgi:hypothetical protein